jgi:outer membrane receptor protein involved in Fe transport
VQQEFKTRGKTISSFTMKADIDFNGPQNRYLALYNTETATPSYALVNVGFGTDVAYSKKYKVLVQFQVNNLFDKAYQSNMSRLKYFEYYTASSNGHLGMYGMGRNFCVRVEFPF